MYRSFDELTPEQIEQGRAMFADFEQYPNSYGYEIGRGGNLISRKLVTRFSQIELFEFFTPRRNHPEKPEYQEVPL